MTGLYTVDASVFLNAANPYESGHEISDHFLRHLRLRGLPVIVPTLLLPEAAATIGRMRNDPALAVEFAATLARLSHLMFVNLDMAQARQACDAAAQHRLRASDAVYVAVALRFGAALVTLDREQHDRAAAVVPVYYPNELQV